MSRDHIISTDPQSGVVFIAGGKWTTYREMAEDVIDHVVQEKAMLKAKKCNTLEIPIIGTSGYTANL